MFFFSLDQKYLTLIQIRIMTPPHEFKTVIKCTAGFGM